MRASGSSPASCRTAVTDTANDASITSDARPPDTLLGSRRPSVALTRKPANGSNGISASTSPLQGSKRIRVQRLAMTEKRDDESESNGRFRGGDGHDEERDDLSVEVAVVAAEGDKRQVHGVQHDLDRQQDRDQVAPEEHACRADGEQRRRQNQIVTERNHCSPSRRARTTAPTIATRIRTEVASNANV